MVKEDTPLPEQRLQLPRKKMSIEIKQSNTNDSARGSNEYTTANKATRYFNEQDSPLTPDKNDSKLMDFNQSPETALFANQSNAPKNKFTGIVVPSPPNEETNSFDLGNQKRTVFSSRNLQDYRALAKSNEINMNASIDGWKNVRDQIVRN